MLNSISVQIFSFIYVFVLSLVYFARRKYNFIESEVYKYLLVFTMIELVLDGINSYLIINNGIDISIVTKLHFVSIFIWFILFALYVLLSRSNKKYATFKELFNAHTGLFTWISITTLLFAVAIALQLCLNFLHINYSMYEISLVYLFGVVIAIVLLLNILLNNKDIAKYKNTAIIVSVVMLVAIIFAQSFLGNSYLSSTSIVSSGLCLITLFQYFTMENPDLKYIDELNALKVKAEEANQAKTNFLASMSHEIRTPMNVINGLSANLLDGNLPQEYKEDIKNINDAGNILLEIVNNILDITKVEAGKTKLNNAPYNIVDTISRLVNMTKLSLSETNIAFDVQINGNIPKLLNGDQIKIYQILMNILSNAVKYTKKGSITFVINSAISGNVDHLTFKVIDTGIGIRKADNARLFEKFERLDQEQTDIQGTGLGLVITKKLLDLMGGKIHFESVYQQGTTFTVEIDQEIVDRHQVDFTTYEAKKVKVDSYFDGRQYKILLVDDNVLNLKVAEKLLKNYNFQITSVRSGLECLNYTKNEKYDLIFLDHMMPEMDGIHTLYNMKQRASGFDTPVVVLTANAIDGSKDMYLKEGFCDYLSKPIDQVELDRILREQLKIGDNAPSNDANINNATISNNQF